MLEHQRRWLAARIDVKEQKNTSKPPRSAARTVGVVADTLGILSFIATALAFFWGDARDFILAGGLVALTFIFVTLNFDLQRRYSREARRARAAPILAECNAHLAAAAVAIARGDHDRFGSDITAATKTLAEAFEVSTGYPCRATVMDMGLVPDDAPDHDPKDGVVKVMCRSSPVRHGSREHSLPQVRRIRDNSDFLSVVEGAELFFSNDLPRELGYHSSTITYPTPEAEYPYRSVITWPIVGPSAESNVEQEQIIGFLCVDAKPVRAFDRSLDAPTGKAVASAMYSSLSVFRQREEARQRGDADEDSGGSK